MKKRIIFGSIMAAVFVGLLWWDHQLEADGAAMVGAPLAGLIALLLAIGYLEVARLLAGAGLPVLRFVGMVCTMGLAIMPAWRQVPDAFPLPPEDMLLVVVGAIVAVTFAGQMAGYRTELAIRRVAGTLLGVAYLGGLAACLLALRVRFGIPAFLLTLVCVKLTDVGAYFTGSAIGKHKMIPWLSPGKSWEGLAGGLVVAGGAAALVNWLGGVGMPAGHAIGFGVVMGLVGQFGDLCESLLKRDAKLKDSGALVPEFGGVLDIVDSPLIAAPVGYVLLAALL